MSQDQSFICKSSLGGPKSCVGGVSGDVLGGSNNVSHIDGVSDMAPACQLCGFLGEGFRKGAMASAHLDDRHFCFSHYITGTSQAAALVLELRVSESE